MQLLTKFTKVYTNLPAGRQGALRIKFSLWALYWLFLSALCVKMPLVISQN